MAAHAGLLRCAGGDALAGVKAALTGNDDDARLAALHVAGELSDAESTRAFAELLPSVSPSVEVALLALLRGRGYEAALPAVDRAARGADPAVRKAADALVNDEYAAGAVDLWLDDASFAPPETDGAAGGARDIRAPFNGKLVRLAVAEGDTVVAGQLLLVIESMKIEHQINAPQAGRVASVRGQAGQQVAPGQALMQLEATA